jgi:hypothetical protein
MGNVQHDIKMVNTPLSQSFSESRDWKLVNVTSATGLAGCLYSVICTGWVQKVTLARRPFLIYCASPLISNHSWFIHQRSLTTTSRSSSEAGETWWKNLTTRGLQLCFPSEGSRATDLIALKNPPSSAEFQPANIGFNDKHATSRPPSVTGCF